MILAPDAQGRIRSLKKLALELFHNSSRGKRVLERKATDPSHLQPKIQGIEEISPGMFNLNQKQSKFTLFSCFLLIML
jgi:hypothetical protein